MIYYRETCGEGKGGRQTETEFSIPKLRDYDVQENKTEGERERHRGRGRKMYVIQVFPSNVFLSFSAVQSVHLGADPRL